MKNFVFIVVGLLTHTALHAQLHSEFDSSVNIFRNKINLTAVKNNFQKLQYLDQPSQPVNDNFVVHLQQPVLRFQYNVNNMNVYQATPDNIYMIKPDNTIAFNMPVAEQMKK